MSVITVSADTQNNYSFGGSTATIRIYANQDFITSDSEIIHQGNDREDQSWYKTVSCTVAANVLSIPQFTIDSTSDSNDQRATYTAILYDSDSNRREVLFGNFRVPHTLGSTLTWAQIVVYSSAWKRPYSTYYSSEQINALILATAATLQPLDADLTAIAALSSAADKVPYSTGPQTWALADFTSFARTLTDDTTATAARSTLSAQETLVSGTNIKTINSQSLLGSGDLAVSALTNETVIYRSGYGSNDLAISAASGKELCYTAAETISATGSIARNVKVSLRGDGVLDIASGQTYTIYNPLIQGDRKWNKGQGKLLLLNASTLPASAWIGAFGTPGYAAEDIDNSETAIDVADASVFGPAPFAIAIDSEIMWVSSVTGNTLTVTRGFDSTSAVTHTASTTAAEDIDISETAIDVTNASAFGAAPYYVLVDSELLYVSSVTGNTLTVTRGAGGTVAATHSNGTVMNKRCVVYPAITTTMKEGMFESAAAGNAAKLIFPPGTWAVKGDWIAPSGLTLSGAGGIPDGAGGTVLKLITNSSHIIHIDEGKRHIYFEDIGFDCSLVTGATAVRISGLNVAASAFLNAGFMRCKFYKGDQGVYAYDETGAGWMALNLYFEQCEFNYQDVACYRSGTVNGSWLFSQCNFSPGATAGASGNAVAGWHNYCGPVTHINCTYNGQTPISPQTIHATIGSINTTSNLITTSAAHGLTVGEMHKVTIRGLQSVTSTVVAAAGITSNGNARSIVTAAGMTNSPKTVTVAVNTTTHTTAALIATEFRTALSADPDVSAFFTVGGTGAVITLTAIAMADNDATMNFTIEDVTSAGITEDTTSSDNSSTLLPAATVNINRLTDTISLHRQEFFFKPTSTTEGYGYLNPHTAFLGNESDFRLNFTDTGTGTLRLNTLAPIRTGKPYATLLLENTITPCMILNCQDESIPYFAIIRNQYETQKALIIKGSIIQSPIRLEANCIVQTEGNLMLANTFQDVHTNSSSVAAKVLSWGDQIVSDGAIGGYKDQGNTVYNTERVTLNGFCSYSQLQTELRPDKGLSETIIPKRIVIDKASAQSGYPALEVVRDRNTAQWVTLRMGIKEAWEAAASKYHDIRWLDNGIDGGITHTWMDEWMEWKAMDANVATTKDGRFLSGDVAFRGRLINVKSTELTPTTGTVTVDSSDGQVFYFSTLTGDVTIDQSSTGSEVARPTEEKLFFIPVTSTSRFVAWGNNFHVPGPRGFQTGTKGSYWVVRFLAFGGNNLMQASRTLVGTDANLRDSSADSWRYPASTSITAITQTNYLTNSGSLTTITLPAEADMQIGEVFRVSGEGSGGWRIAQNASQVIIMNAGGVAGINQTTTGTGGRVDSTDRYDAATIQKIASNTYKLLDVKGSPTLT